MNGRGMKLGAIVAAAASGGLIAGCGSSNHTTAATGHIGGSAIAQAADVSSAAGGEKVTLTEVGQLPSLGTLHESGTGAFNRSPLSGQMLMHVTLPQSAASTAGQSLDLQMIVKNDTMYMKYGGTLGAAMAQKTGKSWISVDYKQLGAQSGLSGISSLFSGSMSEGPASEFKEFEAASTSGVTKVGSATVNGVATTEYSATLNVAKEAADAPPAKRAALQQLLKAVSKDMGSQDVPVKLWIDSNHLIRRFEMTETLVIQGQRMVMNETENILSYGAQPVPSAPPASDVDNLTRQVGQKLSASGAL